MSEDFSTREIESLRAQVEQLDARLKALASGVDALKEPKKKDIWDKMGSLTGVLVALIGGLISGLYQYNQGKQDAVVKLHQEELQKVQTVATFMPYLVGNDDRARSVALFEAGDLLHTQAAVSIAVSLNSARGIRANAGPDPVAVNFLQGVVRNKVLSTEEREVASRALFALCGPERWKIKTVADWPSPPPKYSPIEKTVEELTELPRPSVILDEMRSGAAEKSVYLVTATLTILKSEADGDYHLVLQGPSGKTIVGEIPSPDCISARILKCGMTTRQPENSSTAL